MRPVVEICNSPAHVCRHSVAPVAAAAAQPQIVPACLAAMPFGQRFQHRDSLNRHWRCDPLVRAAVVLGLLLENGPDDEGQRIPVRSEAFNAPDLKAQDLTGSCTDEVGDNDEASREEHVDGACHVTNRCQ